MSLPRVGWRQVSKALSKAGFAGRQGKTHLIFIRGTGEEFLRVTVPLHDPLKSGTLRAIIRQAGMTVEEFNRLNS